MTPPEIVVVVPCYDEAERLDPEAFHRHLAADPRTGFVLVNDGSRDRTLEVLRELAAVWPERVHVVDQQPNQGKAEAVRAGLGRAFELGPTFAGYWDADLATPLDEIEEAAAILEATPEIELVMGARVALLGRTIQRKPSRHYLGRVFATTASLLLGLPVYDTQCGAKLFRVNDRTRGVFDEPFASRWLFDVEMIARYCAARGSGDGIYELPLRQWRDVGESKITTLDYVRAVEELSRIYVRYAWPRDAGRLRGALAARLRGPS